MKQEPRPNEDIAEAFKDNKLKEVRAFVSQLKETDPVMYKILTNVDDLITIDDALGEFYEITSVGTGSVRSKAKQRIKSALENNTRTLVKVNGTNYVLEDYVRDPRLLQQDIPVEVIEALDKVYPQKTGHTKIAQSNNVSNASLISLATTALRGPNEEPVISLDVESRAASPELMNALNRQGLLKSDQPLSSLRNAGVHEDHSGRRKAGTSKDIQSVLIGDIERNINPINGASYGPAFIENGVLVRDRNEGGHVIESALVPELRHSASNIIGEPSQENRAKAVRGKGIDITDEEAFLSTVDRAVSDGNDLIELKKGIKAITDKEPKKLEKALELIRKAEVIQTLSELERRRLRRPGSRGFSNL